MLKPDNNWTWYFDQSAQALALNLGQKLPFHLPINPKYLIADALETTPFTVDDALFFQLYLDAIESLDLSDAKKATLVLTAVAARKYHKPLLPKSWFFTPAPVLITPQAGELVQLQTQFADGVFLLLENSGSASLCLLATEAHLPLTEDKQLSFAEPIKVMNDRLQTYLQPAEFELNRFYALVG